MIQNPPVSHSLCRYNILQRGTAASHCKVSFLSGLEMDVVLIEGNEEGARRRPPNGFSARQFGRAPGYDGKKKEEVSCIKRALARQIRFVVADRKDAYNLFACWEDDMRFDAGTIHPNTLASRPS